MTEILKAEYWNGILTKPTYKEWDDGYWRKWEYDQNGKLTYFEDLYGKWEKYEYDQNNNFVYTENSDGYWAKAEYDENGNEIYFENSDGEVRGKSLKTTLAEATERSVNTGKVESGKDEVEKELD